MLNRRPVEATSSQPFATTQTKLRIVRTLLEDLQLALEDCNKAIALETNLAAIFDSRGLVYLKLGKYDDAVTSLLRAADLSPNDARLYPFLSRAYDSSPAQADEVIKRFRRFAELQPRNGRAQYYYAMSLWKGKRAQDPSVDLHEVEALLKKSIALDTSLAEARLQLGNLYSDQTHYAQAIPYYKRAIALNSDLADAHYRLGQAYVRTNQKDLAQPELALYQQLRAQHLADLFTDLHRVTP